MSLPRRSASDDATPLPPRLVPFRSSKRKILLYRAQSKRGKPRKCKSCDKDTASQPTVFESRHDLNSTQTNSDMDMGKLLKYTQGNNCNSYINYSARFNYYEV